MNPTSLDKQSGAADDGHIARIVRLETQMENVTSVLSSLQHGQQALQRTQEQNQQAMMAQFVALRDRIDAVQQYTMDRLDRLDARTTERIDKLTFWMIGFTVSNLIAVLGIVVRLAVT
ncbi:hypothetical protein SAMN05192549_10394 [Duganella sacchari]|uniref:Uncharacterized protein n=1 Tax=Duganella sacchari TaxID=551987 RepID=A0A1M7MAX2_9BURK|nr:hypothetical protein [Duganella sacchari]SHM87909.1 hypothetical protein SAMN05192549_10394 [Duganella sacchari]